MGRKYIDLTGRSFGRLTALEPTQKRRSNSVVWRCQCECGNIAEVSACALQSGNAKSCGCTKTCDITGQVFGRLTALEPTKKRNNNFVVWRCQCECGNIAEVSASRLRSGNTKSCGCLHKIAGQKNTHDLTGQVFGRLTVLAPTEKRSNSFVVWRCQCECGNITEVSASNLRNGNTKSCGCLHKIAGKKRIHSLTGQVFGCLTVLEPTEKRSNGSVVWRCQCECGNVVEVTAKRLQRGMNPSCGCARKTRP